MSDVIRPSIVVVEVDVPKFISFPVEVVPKLSVPCIDVVLPITPILI